MRISAVTAAYSVVDRIPPRKAIPPSDRPAIAVGLPRPISASAADIIALTSRGMIVDVIC